MIAIAYGCIIETALKRPEARTLEHFLFHFVHFFLEVASSYCS